MDALPNVHPAVAKSMEYWHQLIEKMDMSELPEILAPEAKFRSPMAHNSYNGAAAVHLILSTVVTIFKDFTYYRQFATADGLSVVLEFGAKVQDRELKGVDIIRFNEEGKIVEFEVMVRPMSALQVLGAEMASRLAHLLPKASK